MKEHTTIVNYISSGIELFAAVIIIYASIAALVQFFKSVFSGGNSVVPKVEVRLALGRSLAVALEILLGADILKTAIAPTWNEIGQLAAIATIRTLLNYFLEREMTQTEKTSD